MPTPEKITLAEARKQGKLDQFIAEREGQIGDREAFERTIRSMAGKSKEAPAASPPDDGDD